MRYALRESLRDHASLGELLADVSGYEVQEGGVGLDLLAADFVDGFPLVVGLGVLMLGAVAVEAGIEHIPVPLDGGIVRWDGLAGLELVVEQVDGGARAGEAGLTHET